MTVRSNREHVDEVCRRLDQEVEARFAEVDATFNGVDERLQGMEEKVAKLEGMLRGAPPATEGGLDEKRKHTLVFGGWLRDTQRKIILDEVNEALERLNLRRLTDQAPFNGT